MVDKDGIKSKIWEYFPIPLFLAFFSASTYLFAFYFEKGVFDAYGLPSDLIDIQLNTVLLFAALLIGLLTILTPLISLLVGILANVVNTTLALTLTPIIAVLIYIVILICLQIPLSNWLPSMIALLLVILFLQLVFPLIAQRKTKGYYEKLRAQEKHDSEVRSIMAMTKSPNLRGIVLFISLVIVGTSLAWLIGQSQALNKTKYLALDSDPDLLAVRSYSDRIILVRYDDQSKSLLPQFEIIPLGPNGFKLSERILSTSPLKPTPIQTETPQPSTYLVTPEATLPKGEWSQKKEHEQPH